MATAASNTTDPTRAGELRTRVLLLGSPYEIMMWESARWLLFLHLEVGQRCTERQRAESEDILRLQPLLADATVRAVPDTAGSVRIEVETIDEIPTVFGMHFHGMLPSALRFGDGNVGRQGLYLAASVKRGFAYRTGVQPTATYA